MESVYAVFISLFLVVFFILLFVLYNKMIEKRNVPMQGEEFEVIYQKILNNYKLNFEAIWKRRIIKNIFIFIFILAVSILFGIMMENILSGLFLASIIIGLWIVLATGSWRCASRFKRNKLNRLYKEEVIEKLAQSVNPTLEYRKENRDYLKEEYSKMNFPDGSFKKRLVDDYMVGRIDDKGFSWGELILTITTSPLVKRYRVPEYSVLFARLNYPNNLGKEIRISNKKGLNAGPSLLKEDIDNMFIIPNSMLDDVLVGKLKESLVRFYNKCGMIADIVINNEGIYVRIHLKHYYRGSLFEQGMDPMNKRKIFNYYTIIKMMNELMIEIKNTLDIMS